MNNKQRQEDFAKAAEEYDDSPDAVQRIIARTGFEFGAEHGYQYAVDKACEWLEKNMFNLHKIDEYGNFTDSFACSNDCDYVSEFVEQFRKAMEE